MSTPTNGKIWTWSAWVKRGSLGSVQGLFSSGNGGTETSSLIFTASDTLQYYDFTASVLTNSLITTQVFRDPSAWYHIVVSMDTTQATASNRLKMYVNGVQVTSFSTASYPSLNQQFYINWPSLPTSIGRENSFGRYFDGYTAEINFIDGQALTPASFGSTNALTGVWQPAAYTGTYGTNGFYLPFTDNSALTTSSNVGLGKDFSGNGNYWTTNNISVTSGVTYDSMTDVPTLTNATTANYCVLNPLSNPNGPIYTISNGNLFINCLASSGNAPKMSALGSFFIQSGKWYWEVIENASVSGSGNSRFGIASGLVVGGNFGPQSATVFPGGTSATAATYSGTAPTWTSGDLIGFAFDKDALTLAVYKNGTLQGTFSGLESSVTGWLVLSAVNSSANDSASQWNFGQRPFAYTPPTGFLALNAFNLPTATILKGNTVMDATLYTGNGSTQTITNSGSMQPDFVWIKSRSAIGNSSLTDSVRGVNSQLYSSLTNAQGSQSDQVTAFNSNGFSLGANASGTGSTNLNAVTYVGWQWQAGQGTTSSNTDGTITSQVSVNPTAGFSVVTYTGTGANATIGHGLGVAPKTIFVKERSFARSWRVYNANLASGNVLYLDATDASTSEPTSFNSTAPSSTVFSVGSGAGTNENTNTFVAYCWAEIAGFSKFGLYTGNGSTDGVFVYLGFRPKYVMFKRTNSADQWIIEDAVRSTYNVVDARLFANISDAEVSNGNGNIDFLSNGFKLRNSQSGMNASGGTYIFMAFAENPTKYSLAR
jgi:hypothetical protein